jgi:hypothetical protein
MLGNFFKTGTVLCLLEPLTNAITSVAQEEKLLINCFIYKGFSDYLLGVKRLKFAPT